jgi:hypothetical protein
MDMAHGEGMATTTVGGVAMSEAPITADGRATEGAAGKPTRAAVPEGGVEPFVSRVGGGFWFG